MNFKIILAILLTTLVSYSEKTLAETIFCSVDHRYSLLAEHDTFASEDEVMDNKVNLSCTKRNGEAFVGSLSGEGIGLNYSMTNRMTLICPSMIDNRPIAGIYYGLELSATLMAGVNVGVFGNQYGSCMLLGLNLLGAGVSIQGIQLELNPVNP